MILPAVQAAFRNLWAPQTHRVFFNVLAMSLLTLAAIWFALNAVLSYWVAPWLDVELVGFPSWAAWISVAMTVLSTVGLAVGLVLLMAPVTALIAGFFLDDIAEAVERRDYPSDAPGTSLPLGASLLAAFKFAGIVLLANLLALFLYFIPGINLVAFFLINGYLLGREYFEFAAMRHMSAVEARALRGLHQGRVLLAGCIAAMFLAVPFVNLLTPLFAAAMMVHLVKSMRRRAAVSPRS